jgi:hypothetical protein
VQSSLATRTDCPMSRPARRADRQLWRGLRQCPVGSLASPWLRNARNADGSLTDAKERAGGVPPASQRPPAVDAESGDSPWSSVPNLPTTIFARRSFVALDKGFAASSDGVRTHDRANDSRRVLDIRDRRRMLSSERDPPIVRARSFRRNDPTVIGRWFVSLGPGRSATNPSTLGHDKRYRRRFRASREQRHAVVRFTKCFPSTRDRARGASFLAGVGTCRMLPDRGRPRRAPDRQFGAATRERLRA